MNILITGGAGFIGSHLAERCVKRGDTVYVIDDLSTGALANIQHLTRLRNFHIIVGSVTDHGLMSLLIDRADLIYHLAAAVGVRLILQQPIRSIEVNLR